MAHLYATLPGLQCESAVSAESDASFPVPDIFVIFFDPAAGGFIRDQLNARGAAIEFVKWRQSAQDETNGFLRHRVFSILQPR